MDFPPDVSLAKKCSFDAGRVGSLREIWMVFNPSASIQALVFKRKRRKAAGLGNWRRFTLSQLLRRDIHDAGTTFTTRPDPAT
jgi:hypothetical protein